MPFVEHQNSLIHFRADGAGAPVVALHGSASSGYQWESLTGYIAGRHRVIRPDLPGYGKSAPLATAQMSLPAMVTRLAAVFREIGEPFHLVGHSFGGAVALKVAQTMPHMVRSLVVIEPAAFHLLADDAADRAYLNPLAGVADAMRADRAAGDDDTAMARFIDFWNGDSAWASTSQGLRDKLLTTLPQVIADFTAIASERATFADYAQIACPVLAVTGRQSPAVTQHLTERLARHLPTAELAEIADAGHMAPLTDPHVIDPMIARHVQAAERREARVCRHHYCEAA